MDDAPDDSQWRHWFRTYGGRLLLAARQWSRSEADAEDIVQDAFVRYWRHQRHLPGDPLPLMLVSVRRAALDRIRGDDRRGQRETAHAADQSVDWFDPGVGSDDERRRRLESAVVELPAEQREVLVLKVWGELTFAEIADQLALSPNTVASRYRYALTGLRRSLAVVDCHG